MIGIGIGIVGCGRIGVVHGTSLQRIANANLVAVSDPLEANAAHLAKMTGAQVRSVDALIEADDIAAVIIATPTTTHYELIHKAARAGKAIFCEKPIDMNAERIRECTAIVEECGVPFMTGFNRRFDPGFSRLRYRILRGDIGDVELVTILSRDPSPPPVDYIRSSGGIFRDMMIHDLDMARFLIGEEPVTVHSVGSCLIDPAIGEAGDLDTAAATLTTASGKICQISNSRRATYGYDQRVEVHGSKGMLRAENMLDSNIEFADENGFRRAPAQPFFLERYHAAYIAELTSFTRALETGHAMSPSAIDGLKAQQLADAASRSAEDGCVVRL